MNDADHVPVRNLVAADFDAVYARSYRRVLALAISLTSSRQAAEELTQDAFIEAYRRWDHVGHYDDPVAYVRRVVATRSISRWRSLTRETLAFTRLGTRVRADDEQLGSPQSGEHHEQLWAAIRTLPGQQRQVIALYYVNDLTVPEIAELLGRNEGTVKTQLHRARHTLAERLGTTYLDDPKEA